MFGETNVYITNLLKHLWENPKIVSILLLNSSKDDIKYNLGDFFVNNFYENIVSTNCVENNLLYLITLLLKDEVKNLKNPGNSDNFLKNSIAGIFLEKLVEKEDIKIYFKNSIGEVIENLKNCFANEELTFDTKKLNANIINNKKDNNDLFINEIGIFNYMNKNIELGNNHEKDHINDFNKNYIKPLKEDSLNLFLSENQNKASKNNIKEFINNINNHLKLSPNSYGTKTFLKNINNNKEILNLYKNYFFKISNYFDSILDNLLNNLNILPYQIKCICKIISKLIENKFPKVQNYEKNKFVSKFFFFNLFSSMFLNPGYITLINDFIISKVQENNLSIINKIIENFVAGKFYKDDQLEGNYTPFNWLFIEKMPKLNEFYEKIINVNLPNFIEKLIDGEDIEYKYKYFEENKNEIISHSSFCFSLDDLYVLVKNIENCKELLLKENKKKELEKTIKKILIDEHKNKIYCLKRKKESEIEEEDLPEIKSYRTTQVVKKPKNAIESNNSILINLNKDKEKEVLKFFLISNLLINDEYENYIDMNKDSFEYKEKNNKKNIEIDENIKSVNKVKNFLYSILSNYKELNKDDFIVDKITNIENILNEMKKNMKLLNILIDESIPSDWYIDPILDLLKELPEKFIINDCEELLYKLEKDINNSIKHLNFNILASCMNRIKIAKNKSSYYDNVYNTLINIKLNLKINYIIKKSFIPIEIKYKKNSNWLQIKPISEIITNITKNTNMKHEKIKPNINIKDPKEKSIILICHTIEEFTKKFPNLSKDSDKQKNNILNCLEKVNFPDQLNICMKFINSAICKEKIIKNESEVDLMLPKIYDYIMEQLYPKLFPIESDSVDNMIYLNCKKVSWIQPEHLIKEKKICFFKNFINDLTNIFEKIEKEKCPRKKFACIEEIFKCISNLNIFNRLKSEGIDDEIPILHFGLIKAKPQRISSNCQYLRLFLGNKKEKKEDNHLTQIYVLASQVAKLNHTSLINVSKDEYYEKCKQNMLKFI